MGHGLIVKCAKCRFKGEYRLGVGMMFPGVYQRVVEAIRNGDYGEEWQKFFEENTGAAIVAEKMLYQCSNCNSLVVDYDLSLYNHKEGMPPKHDYWPHWCSCRKEYEFVKSYEHICPKCKIRMETIPDIEENSIPCPRCGKPLSVDDSMCWD